MNKAQAVQEFWSSFGLPAYDEASVPKEAKMPYITYHFAKDSLDRPVSMYASIWDYNSSWQTVERISDEISERITTMNAIKLIDGYLYIAKGSPFAQRMIDTDDYVRRMYINIMAEYLTNY